MISWQQTYRTYKTQGNYNNEIGLPYTALHMPDDTEKSSLRWGKTAWETFTSCQPWLSQKQPLLP